MNCEKTCYNWKKRKYGAFISSYATWTVKKHVGIEKRREDGAIENFVVSLKVVPT